MSAIEFQVPKHLFKQPSSTSKPLSNLTTRKSTNNTNPNTISININIISKDKPSRNPEYQTSNPKTKMGATNTWYCISCKTFQYGSVSVIRPCKNCNYMMTLLDEPQSVAPMTETCSCGGDGDEKTEGEAQDGGSFNDEKADTTTTTGRTG
ncbi:hypothetical protein NHQ30_008365 [Ciborinia camelliae]|nr:hypothetical protein NHQ30_008365 [Ciborinia camelliae]